MCTKPSPFMTRRMSECLSAYGSWPLYEAAMKGGSPQAISVSPAWSLLMFWMPAPGTTLMLKLASWLRTSSTKPPACAYHPPPIWPAVQVRFFCCAHAAAPPSPRASARTIVVSRLMIVLRRSSGSCPSSRAPRTVLREAAGIEKGEVEGGRAVHEPLGDIPAGGGRMLEAVAAEADGEEEALDARRPAADGVIVGRERAESRPAAGDPRVGDDRQAVDRLLHRLLDLPPIHRDVEVLANVLDVTRAQEDLLHLFPEIEATRHIARERHRARDLGEGLREEDVAAPGVHRQVETREPADARRRGAGRVDDDGRRDLALRRRHARHASVRHRERRHRDPLRDRHAELARAAREAGRHLGGGRHRVLGPPDRRHPDVDPQGGDELLRVGRGDDAHVGAELPLERDPRLEPAKLLLLGEEIEVADLPVARIDAELVREPPEDVDALQGEADLGLGRELNADAACRLAGRARADGFALEEDDVAEPAAGQVVGDRAAHHAAADDHRAGRPRQAHEAGI